MVDTLGKATSLYSIKAPYILICFWDPTCGHCQKEVPQLDSLISINGNNRASGSMA